MTIENALIMKKCNEKSILHIIKKANHVFGAKHPYLAKELPQKVEELLFDVKQFISN